MMIFKNARCIFAEGVREGMEIATEHGRITSIRPASGQSSGESIDLNGNYLAPGFIDLHVHGAIGRDTMEGSADAFRAICDYHATGGTTSICLTTATAPIDGITRVLQAIGSNREALPQIAGAHVEGPFLSREKPGAQEMEFIRDPDVKTVAHFMEHADVIRRITIAPELPGASEAIRSFYAAGMSVSGGHSNAWDEEARAAFECGMRSVTHTFNCMSSARRRGVERVAGLLEFALSEPAISCELIADGHHDSSTLMKMLLRAKGVAGICLVTDATAGAGLPEGASFLLAGKPCLVRGGVCLLADGSALAGSASRMIDLVRVMIREGGVSVHEAVQMATENPARAIGLHRKGRFEIGADADFVVMSEELKVIRTVVAGHEIFCL
jgi:N-acetylglucosamine-6-phosphate deacetylase